MEIKNTLTRANLNLRIIGRMNTLKSQSIGLQKVWLIKHDLKNGKIQKREDSQAEESLQEDSGYCRGNLHSRKTQTFI